MSHASLVVLLLLGSTMLLPRQAHAEPLTLRYSGTAPLEAFGGPPDAQFRGTVTWDPYGGWVPAWEGCPDFCLDGTAGAVSATFILDGIDYANRIETFSRLMVMGSGALILELYFGPPIHLGAEGSPDLRYVGLNLWSEPADYSIFIDNTLPLDTAFLGQLNDRFVQFSASEWDPTVIVDSPTVVPEPSSMTLALAGLISLLALARHSRR